MRIWLRWLGLTVVCVAAVVASFSTLASLAEFTGWGAWQSWLLPLSLDALGMTACLVWLDSAAPKQSRRYAKYMTWSAAGFSVLGNGAGHLASTGHLAQGLLLVVLVGSVPPAALAVTVHLIVSVSAPGKAAPKVRDAAPVPAPERPAVPVPAKKAATPKPKAPSPAKSGPDSTGPEVDDVLMQKARHVAKEYESKHGKQPSRDALKTELGCGTGKATAIAAALKKEREAA